MKFLKKKNTDSLKVTSSPKVNEPESSKVSATNFSKWKEKMEKGGGNFRQRAERAGVPPEMVKDFKYWLRENNYEQTKGLN